MGKLLRFVMLQAFIVASIIQMPQFTETAAAATNPVTKENWIEQMAVIMPKFLCADNQYFRKCFGIDQSGCNTETARAVKACMDKYTAEMPASLSPKDGESWGRKITECAYESYESNLKASAIKKIESAQCKDLSRLQ
ncbi:MAG: hypothetical protein HQL01_11125 [Nitrospirae bacterium]|nr:hypothetical protein [Nitrospirota bacterium]